MYSLFESNQDSFTTMSRPTTYTSTLQVILRLFVILRCSEVLASVSDSSQRIGQHNGRAFSRRSATQECRSLADLFAGINMQDGHVIPVRKIRGKYMSVFAWKWMRSLPWSVLFFHLPNAHALTFLEIFTTAFEWEKLLSGNRMHLEFWGTILHMMFWYLCHRQNTNNPGICSAVYAGLGAVRLINKHLPDLALCCGNRNARIISWICRVCLW